MMSRLVPWMVMGLSMGVGYFGLESLMRSNQEKMNGKKNQSTKRRRRRHSLYSQLLRQVQQMETMMSLENIPYWFVQCWTLPVASYDILWGVFLTVLPAQTSPIDLDPAKGAARVLVGHSSTTSTTKENRPPIQPNNTDEFLTLPPQLHPRLPPKPSNNYNGKNNNNKKERYVEMLLHSVSHTDLVLGLEAILSSHATTSGDATGNSTEAKTTASSLKSMCLGRPRFSAFDMYCRKMLQALEQEEQQQTSDKAEIILVPQYQRAQNDPRYTIQPSTDRPHVATGFCWKTTSANSSNKQQQNNNPRLIPLTQALADLRVRGKDIARLDPCYEAATRTNDDEATVSWNMVAPDGTTTTATTDETTTAPSRQDVMVELKAIFFPLLATLLPRWHAQIAKKHHKTKSKIQKVLVLVTGVGTPRNWTHSVTGNSTQMLAHLMERFLAKVHPDITVVKIHSDTNIFRYDDNILFVQQELLPTVNAYRDAHAMQAPYPHEQQQQAAAESLLLIDDDDDKEETVKHGYLQQLRPRFANISNNTQPFDVDWKKTFAVTLSFADGSPARTHAIQTALRFYRPAFLHIWQLKTFWHERKIVDDDAEVHSFEEMETSPALESTDIREGLLAQVVQEMKAFREEMTETLLMNESSNDIHSFWLRKTHKPVLAVLLVQTADGPPVLYRGTNMEVSMPTGSLCAERNVIGTALASNPKLKREDLKCIAVLAVPQPKASSRTARAASSVVGGGGNSSISEAAAAMVCGSARSSRHNSLDATNGATTTMTGGQMRRQSFDEREEDWALSGSGSAPLGKNAAHGGEEAIKIEMGVDTKSQVQQNEEEEEPSTPLQQISLFKTESSNSLVDMIKQSPSGISPSRHASSLASAGAKDNRKTVLVRSNADDINPLRPCGACHEWLKKIAECNPYFQILTFTDAHCNGVYLTPCHE
ncbi:expressed unknown protein [Seminavis robusta]|uniref:Uncharacterized protein n=1 Tax=Seminavis robusta TaxID=568900 RepID=A0A9N8HTT3_9STRA|nr:expressed unknown protein [Seminavis robusta]|eukprot:Sro1938_g306510.1 n/a (934) ;mRNA; r:8262-11063